MRLYLHCSSSISPFYILCCFILTHLIAIFVLFMSSCLLSKILWYSLFAFAFFPKYYTSFFLYFRLVLLWCTVLSWLILYFFLCSFRQCDFLIELFVSYFFWSLYLIFNFFSFNLYTLAKFFYHIVVSSSLCIVKYLFILLSHVSWRIIFILSFTVHFFSFNFSFLFSYLIFFLV